MLWISRLIKRGSSPLLAVLLVLVASASGTQSAAEQQAQQAQLGPVSKLPLPRFVSLKSDRVNLHEGPSKEHPTRWVYQRAGLPVEITAEFENWRRVRDWDGDEGWVYHSLLSGRRTVLVAPTVKNKRELLPLFERPDQRGAIVARLEPRVMGSVKRCTGTWCRISGKGFDGWIQQGRLWGVYPNEQID